MAVNYQEMMSGKKKKSRAVGTGRPTGGGFQGFANPQTGQAANMAPGVGQQPQIYGNNQAVNQPPGVGGNTTDPLVNAIVDDSAGGAFGVNNQNNNRAVGTGRPTGSDVFQQNINPEAGKPANMPPPPPPPPTGNLAPNTPANMAPGTGATPPPPDYKSEVMNAIRNNPAAFRGAGIRNFKTADGKGIMDLPPEVRAEVDQFLGGTEFQQMASVGTTPTAPVASPPPTQQPTQQQAQAPVATAPPPTMQQAQAPTQPTMAQAQAPAQPTMQQAQGMAQGMIGGYTNPYAEAAAQQPDTGLRTFSGRPEFSPMQQQLQEQQRPEFSDPLQDALQAQYMSRIGGTDDPILASQLADQQMRQEEAQRDLIERLGRFGVLRGGGDTAAALARMGEGDERNRLALEAQAAQRMQQDMLNAQGFGESRSRQDIARGDFGLRESQTEQDMLTQALNRDIQRAGMTGEFEGGRTLAAQEQAQRMRLAEEAEQRARAGLTGQFEGGQTMQAERQRAELGALAGQEDRAERALGSDLLNQGQRRRLNELEETRRNTGFLSERENQELNRLISEAEQTGQFRGDTTLRGQQVASSLDSEDLRRELLRSQEDRTATGFQTQEDRLASEEDRRARGFETQEDRLAAAEGRAATGFETQEDRLLSEEDRRARGFETQEDRLASAEGRAQEGFDDDLLTRALSRDVTEAGQTGRFRGDRTEQSELARADRLGRLGDEATMAGRDQDIELIGQIQAAIGADADPALIRGLAQNLKNFDPASLESIREGIDTTVDASKVDTGTQELTSNEDGFSVTPTGNEDVDAALDDFMNREDLRFNPDSVQGFRTTRDADGDLVVEWKATKGNSAQPTAFRGKFNERTGEFSTIPGKYGGKRGDTGEDFRYKTG